MLKAQLLHNPSAGDEDHSEEELVRVIESHGFVCRYSSTKENDWKEIRSDTDFLIIAGGDGTVRQIAKKMLLAGTTLPVAILPKGTANNIAKSLQIGGSNEEIIDSWKKFKTVKFSIGNLINSNNSDLFLESIGMGLIPLLITEMKNQGKDDIEDPSLRMRAAWNLLGKLTKGYSGFRCNISANGNDYEGVYLLAEIMNIKSIGPNLVLAPDADSTDDLFDVILIPVSERERLGDYIYMNIKSGTSAPFPFPVIRSSSVTLSASGHSLHADDEIISNSGKHLVIDMHSQTLDILAGNSR